MVMTTREATVHLRSTKEHQIQDAFVNDETSRIVVKAGRRGGKTYGIAKRAVKRFLKGRRQLYGSPTTEQVEAFWFEVCRALAEPIQLGLYKKNEAEHTIEREGTKQRIRAKTCWNANTLRGDYADDLYLDEFQLMAEDTWDEVGAPMLLDTNGSAIFIFTPPSLNSSGISKARDPRHASKFFKEAQTKEGWKTYHFTSFDNPYISVDALNNITKDMTLDAYRREILAEDDEIETSWLVYNAFNTRVCRIPRFPIPINWLIYSGHDFGGANPAALFFAQDPATGLFYAFKEYLPGSGKSTAQHVEAFKEMTKGYNVIRRAGGSHQEEEIRQGYATHGWVITEPTISNVLPQIDRVIGMMQLNKGFVFSDMTNYLTELANCLWKLDFANKPTNVIQDEARYHLCACARYILSSFVPETVNTSGRTIIRPIRFGGK